MSRFWSVSGFRESPSTLCSQLNTLLYTLATKEPRSRQETAGIIFRGKMAPFSPRSVQGFLIVLLMVTFCCMVYFNAIALQDQATQKWNFHPQLDIDMKRTVTPPIRAGEGGDIGGDGNGDVDLGGSIPVEIEDESKYGSTRTDYHSFRSSSAEERVDATQAHVHVHIPSPPSSSSSSLPDFSENSAGGVILFYHVAKTGGTTIRNMFETMQTERPDVFSFIRVTLWEYHIFADYYEEGKLTDKEKDVDAAGTTMHGSCDILPTRSGTRRYQSVHKTVKEFLSTSSTSPETADKSSSSPKTLLLELHGGEFGLKSLAPYLKRWRKLSQKNNKQFFAFTVIRDPAAFTTSYFNFFHYGCNERWCDTPYKEATESNLVSSTESHPHLQCFLLMHDIHASFYAGCPPSQQDCEDLYDNVIKKHLDWVGTTEKLSEETMPLLAQMIENSALEKNGKDDPNDDEEVKETKQYSMEVKNVGQKGIQRPLTSSSLADIASLSSHDQTLYDRVQSDFTLKKRYPTVIL